MGGGGILTGGGGCFWAKDGANCSPVPDVELHVGNRKIGIVNTLPRSDGQALGLREEVNKEGVVLNVPEGLDVVDVGGGGQTHQAGGHYKRAGGHSVHALTVYSAVNMDIPINDNLGRVALDSHEGAPNPWVAAPLAMGYGYLWVLDRRCIHQGGGGSPYQNCP